MHRYLRIVTSFQRVTQLTKSVSMQQHFEHFIGKQRRLERKFLRISEAELLRFDCVNLFYLQGQCRAVFRFIYDFTPIEYRIVR